MNTVYVYLSRFVLMLCLAWYGIFATADVGDAKGALGMQICANGMVDPVRIDTYDSPEVTSGDSCPCPCTGVCRVAGMMPRVPFVERITRSYQVQRDFDISEATGTRISNFRPLPRAPPAPSSSMMTPYDVIACDYSSMGHFMHGKGRLLQKDPSA